MRTGSGLRRLCVLGIVLVMLSGVPTFGTPVPAHAGGLPSAATAVEVLSDVELRGGADIDGGPEDSGEITAQGVTWTAYNDCSNTTGGNTTAYTISGTTSGLLKNYDTGANTAVTAAITKNGSISTQTSSGAYSNSGTDAYETFYGKANMVGVINYASSTGWWVDVTFTGLDPAKTYTFATTANRADSTYTRDSKFTISDVDSATNASTSGVTVISNESVYFNTGYNTVNGYVARWTGIQAGTDGDFKVRVEPNSGYYAYGPSVFMLQEQDTSPTITTSGTLSAFSTQPGVASAAQTYTVSGSNLTADIGITAPTGFELSTNGTDYSSSLTLSQSSGAVPSTTVYVRLNSATEGTFTGNIAHTSSGATDVDVAVSGSVLYVYTLTVGTDGNGTMTLSPTGGSYNSDTTVTLTPVPSSGYVFGSWSGANAADVVDTSGVYTIVMNGNKSVTANFSAAVCSTVSLVASEDTYLSGANTTNNYGGSSLMKVTSGSSTKRGALLKWDVSSIPVDAIVSSASLTLNVSQAQSQTYYLYNMRRAWVEGTNDGASGTGASWTYYGAGTGSWGTGGAANVETDRFDTNLWGAGATTFSSTGSKTVELNASGIAAVQGWIAETSSNHGVAIQNYSSTSSNDLQISSSENTTEANRPKLNVTYCVVATEPTIVTAGTLTEFSTQPGVASAAQSYTVSGSNLTADISIVAPVGFALSTNGTDYSSSLTLSQSSGVVGATTIYVRLYSTTESTFSGDIVHTSSGATDVDVAVSGTVALVPTELTFQEGVSSYAGTLDTTIKYTGQSTSYGTQAYFEWDTQETAGSDTPEIGLLQFADIFGSGAGQIPLGSTIESATLRYRVYSNSNSSGDSASVYESLISWDEATTYSTFGGDAGVQADEYNSELVATATAASNSTYYTIDVTPSLQRWLAGTANYGWVFLPDASDGVEVHSSEATTSDYRPLLTVFYLPPAGPTITTEGTLGGFSSSPGVPSAEQSYTVSGSNLAGAIAITAPADFEISLASDSGFDSTLSLTPSDGSVPATTIYVRFNRATEGTSGGDITHVSAGATTQNVAVSGEAAIMPTTVVLQDGLNGYTGTRDTYIYDVNPSTAHGGDSTMVQDKNTNDERRSLLLFDLSPIPAGSTIVSSELQFYVDTEGQGFNMYRMLVPWDEATVTYHSIGDRHFAADGTDAQSTVDATWPGDDGYTGFITVAVPASTIEDWVDGALANNGWLMIATDSDDGQQLATREYTTQADRPMLTVEYFPPSTDPTITVTGTPLSAFSSAPGVPSTEQTYTVAGSNLTADIAITAPADFEISTTSGSGFGSSLSLPRADGSVAETTVYVRFNRATAGISSGDIAHASEGATTQNVAVSGTAASQPPEQPVLVQPADGGTSTSTSPVLEVTVTDPESDAMSVSFYGREAGATGECEEFTVVAIPDTQNAAQSYPAVFNSETQWIVDNKSAENIAFVTHLGDIVNTASSATQWQNADAAMDILDAGNVYYSVGPGNHDLGGLYETYFGISRFSGKPWYGGYYGSDNANNYSLFSASGMDFIVINLQYSPTTAQLDWADGLLKANSTRRGIVASHNILNIDNTWQYQNTFTELKDNPNLFLMLCGHMHSSSDGSAYRAELGTDGHTIHVLLTDYQDYANGGNGYLRLLRFAPSEDKIYAKIYSPYLGAYLTNASNYEQFEMAYDMECSGSGDAYSSIGTVSNVASGANTSVTWADLTEGTEYEWYATVSDDGSTTTGAEWSFTAGNLAQDLDFGDAPDPAYPTLLANDGARHAMVSGLHLGSAIDAETDGQPDEYAQGDDAVPDDEDGVTFGSLVAGSTVSVDVVASAAGMLNAWLDFNADGDWADAGEQIFTDQSLVSGANGLTFQVPASATAGYTYARFRFNSTGGLSYDGLALDGEVEDYWVGITAAPEQYSLSVATSGNGTVTSDPPGGTYASGTSVQLTATADPGWTFSGWSGDLTGSENPANVTMDGNKTVTATFTQNTYTLTINKVGNGTVALDPAGGSYLSGTDVSLTATADPGWTFSGWSGALSGSTSPANVAMDGDKTVTATFTQDTYTLTINKVGNGTVALDPAGGSYLSGTDVSLTATADPGWTFTGWSGALSGTDNPATLTMDGNKSVTATFTQDTYTLTINKVGNGTVALDPAGGSYLSGTDVSLTATADPGWTFSGWSGDLSGTDNPASLTMDRNKSVMATFTQDTYTLTINKVGSGTVALDPAGGSYLSGTDVSLTATADPGWTFSGWSGDLSGSASPANVTMSGNRSVTATFTTMSASGSASSAVEPSNVTPIVGSQIAATISIDVSGVAEPDHKLGSFTANLSWDTSVLSYTGNSGIQAGFGGVINASTDHVTFNGTNVNGATGNFTVLTINFDVVGVGTSELDLEYSAMAAATTFANLLPNLTVSDAQVVASEEQPTQYTITASAGACGSIDPAGAVIVTAGQNQSFTIAPDADCQIMDVVVDGSSAGALTSYTFNDVQADHTISVVFAQIEELGPGGNDPEYDGNEDGTPDWQQNNVTSFHTITDDYITLVSPDGTSLDGVDGIDNPDPGTFPSDLESPYGFLGFTIAGLTNGGAATVSMELPAAVDSYWKYGPTPDNHDDHWYEFAFDGTTGAQISGNTVVLHFVDGLRGDGDFTANGTIVDPGGPVVAESTTVTLDGGVSSNTLASGSSISVSHTTGTGTNRLMLVGVSWNSSSAARTISSVTFTYGSTSLPLTSVGTQQYPSQNRYMAIYSLLAPPSGQAGTVTVTFSGAVTAGTVAGVANFAGVDQASPVGTFTPATGTSSTQPSVDLTGLVGDELVFDTVFAGGSPYPTLTVGAGQNQLWNGGVGNASGGGSTKQATGSSVTMSWTRSGTNYWIIGAVPIHPAAGTSYNLTIAADPSEGGTTNPTVGVHAYAEGTVLDVTATPATGYVFHEWSGDCNGTGTCQVTMNGDRSVTANFTQITHVLTVNVEGSGSVTPDPDQAEYAYGTVVELTAVPDTGWAFTGWTGDVTGSTNPASVTMNADLTVTAHFSEIVYHNLTMAVGAGGGGTTTPTTGTHAVAEGTVVDISAIPDTGYAFDHWVGDVADADAASTTVAMDGDQTVTAYFVESTTVTLDGEVSSGTGDDVSNISFSHTTGTGTNRLMLVGVSWNCGTTNQTISSVTFTPDGGSPTGLTEVWTEQTGTQYRYSAIYSLLAPPSGQAGAVTVTFSGSVGNGIVAGVANFAGVDQTTPLGLHKAANGSSTAPSVEVTELDGDELVFDNVFQGASNDTQTLTAGADQTRQWHGFAGNTRGAASIEQATSDSVTMSWTAASSSYWAIVAVPINPAAAALNEPPVVDDIPDQTIAEGASFATIALDGYVEDPDDDDSSLGWSYSGNTSLVVDITDRVATIGIPSAEWNGSETITFRATDPGSLYDEDTATFTVTAVNDAPVVSDIPDQTIAEGASFTTIALDGYVSDVDNTAAQMTWTYSGETSLVVDITDRVATISVPNEDWNGAETITFTAEDPGHLSASNEATFTVTAVNDAPVVSDIPDQTIAEGASFTTIALDGYVEDPDDDDSSLGWSYSGNTNLSVSITNRVATITVPNPEWNGSETITFRATDPGLLYGEDTATFTVTAVNDAPVVSDIPDQTIAEGASFAAIALDGYVEDPDDDDSSLGWSYSGNTNLSVSITNRVATITVPNPDWNGSETITFRATDPGLLYGDDTATFTVTAVNDAPVVSDIPDQTIAEGASFTTIALDGYVEDVDNTDDQMTWTASGNTSLVVDITNRVATITVPYPDWNGSETVTFTATDPGSESDSDQAVFTVTVGNDAPVVSDIPDQTIAEGASFTTIALDGYVEDPDDDDSSLGWSYSGNTNLSVSITNRVATISVPSPDWNGAETITFRATDPGLLYDEDAATFTVTAVNDAPVVSDIPDQTIAEGASFTTIALDNYVSDVDNADGQMLWAYSGNSSLSVSIVDRVATIGTPNADWNGAETITFTATDPGLLYDDDGATFTVTAVNDAPVVSDIPDQTIAEGASFTTIALDDYVEDVDNADAAMTWTTSGETSLSVAINENRVATITAPNADWNGSETITFTATDPGGLSDSDAATFTVTAGNDAPIVSDIPDQTIAEGASFTTITLDNYVSDVDNADDQMLWAYSGNSSLTVSIVDRVATIGIPNADWNGAETITFTATDPGGLSDSDAATFTVTAVNDAPVVGDIPNQTVAEGASFTTIALDSYVSDVDNTDAQMTWGYSGNSSLTVSIVDRVATIGIPNEDWNGAETITFTATDPGGLSDSDAATFTVTAGNDAPIAVDDSATTPQDTAVDIDVLANDTDVDDDVLSVDSVSDPTHGTASIQPDKRVNYAPDSAYSGADSFTYVVSDGNGGTDSATVNVSVTATGPSGSALASAVPSDATPLVGEQIEVQINIDVTNVDAPDHQLGSFSSTLDWDPTVLTYVGNSGLLSGFAGSINTNEVDSGHLIFNGANATGATGDVQILTITFDVADEGTSELVPGFTAMASAYTFRSLLGILTIEDGSVETSAPPTHDLAVTVVGDGVVTLNPLGGTYDTGSTVTLTPQAEAGWAFAGWTGPDADDLHDNGDGTWNLVMSADREVTATFTQLSYTLSTAVDGQGTVTLNPSGGVYLSGTVVTATADAAAGWAFVEWTGSVVSTGNPVTTTMDADKAVTAVFQDTTAPDTTITTQPANLTNSTTATFAFTSDDPEATFECSLNGAEFSACDTPKEYTGLADGAYSFAVRAKDGAGNVDATPASHGWTIDTAAPDTSITTTPPDPSNARAGGIGFASTEDGSTFECALDSGGFSSCTSPYAYSGLADGLHSFLVRATDGAGNEDATSASYDWTIDTVAPETSITSTPADPSNSSGGTMSFASSEDGSTFACALDGGGFTSCTSPYAYSGLADGAHTFQVQATDDAGNTDGTPAEFAWTIDTTAPETSITAMPADPSNSSGGSMSFASSEDGSTFECALDSGGFTSCTSPYAYSGLADGAHTFQVQATDDAGNTDGTPAEFAWTIDTVAPDTTLTTTPADPSNSAGGNIGFESAGDGSTFECALDGAAFGACTSPYAYSGLADGAHTFAVRATDDAGNTDGTPAEFAWTIDTVAPETSITTPPADPSNSASGNIGFASSEDGSTFECALDGAGFATCTSPYAYSGLADGAHTFQVQATDDAGNTDGTPADFGWSIDTTAPDTSITTTPADPSNSASGNIGFASTEDGSTFECALDGAGFATCTSPYAYSGLADGAHTFQVQATDDAGNTDGTPADFGWSIDTTAPETSITSTPADPSNSSGGSMSFASSEDGSTFACALDGGGFTSCTSPYAYSGLADGAHTFQVQATDDAGNTDGTPAEFAWTIDTTAPETSITAMPADPSNAVDGSFGFGSDDPAATFECQLGSSGFSTCTSPYEYTALLDGAHTFQVRAIDTLGNTDATPASYGWTVDTFAPDTGIVAGPSALSNSADASFDFIGSEPGSTFECSLDAAEFGACVTPTEFSGLADGAHTFAVRATDAAGNTDPLPAEYAWTIDTTAPETVMTDVPDDPSNQPTGELGFASNEDGSTFECQLDGSALAGCASPYAYDGLADGTHRFEVRATDAAGNSDPTPAVYDWTIDTAAPETTITDQPANPSSLTSANFTFESDDPAASFECALDGSGFGLCTSPQAYAGLADGVHAFLVRAVDAAGNVDETPASFGWTIDATVPDTTITAHPDDPSVSAEAAFAFESDDSMATFECKLDTGEFSACTSPLTYTGLADGAHHFEVRAVDGLGNMDPTPAVYDWTVDTEAPETNFTEVPGDPGSSPNISISFGSDDPTATFECQLDDGGYDVCTSPKTYTGLGSGSHLFEVRAVDAAGNADPTPSSFGWTINWRLFLPIVVR